MLENMDAQTLLVLAGAVAGGFVQGLSGFAFGLVGMAFWAWFVAPQLTGPMVVFGSLIGQLLSVHSVRRGYDRQRVLPFVWGGVIGIPIGVYALGFVDPVIFKAGVGAILSAYCTAALVLRRLPRVTAGGRLADAGAGFIGGVMGGIGGLTGPAPTLWCALRGWSPDAQRAVFQTYNIAMQALTRLVYASSGFVTAETLRMFALIVPVMVVPNLIGVRLYRRFSEAGFRRLILLLLSLSGFALLATSIPKLAG